jgi:hypothetical protein
MKLGGSALLFAFRMAAARGYILSKNNGADISY